MQGVKWTHPKSNCVPGLTRDVTFFQFPGSVFARTLTLRLSNHPRLYCLKPRSLTACSRSRLWRLRHAWRLPDEEDMQSTRHNSVRVSGRRNDPERNAKLGVLKCMPDHIAGEIYLADYLLYRLNRRFSDLFFTSFIIFPRGIAFSTTSRSPKPKLWTASRLPRLELPGPTDDIRYLCAHISALLVEKVVTQAGGARSDARNASW